MQSKVIGSDYTIIKVSKWVDLIYGTSTNIFNRGIFVNKNLAKI
jgi:hypothetical protein